MGTVYTRGTVKPADEVVNMTDDYTHGVSQTCDAIMDELLGRLSISDDLTEADVSALTAAVTKTANRGFRLGVDAAESATGTRVHILTTDDVEEPEVDLWAEQYGHQS